MGESAEFALQIGPNQFTFRGELGQRVNKVSTATTIIYNASGTSSVKRNGCPSSLSAALSFLGSTSGWRPAGAHVVTRGM